VTPPGDWRPGSPGWIAQSRLQAVREMYGAGWSSARITDACSREWNITRQAVGRYVQIVRREAEKDYEANKGTIHAEMRAQLQDYYRRCMDAGDHAAAGKYFERMFQLMGLDGKRIELTGANGGPLQVQAASIDLTKLTDEQFAVLGQVLGMDAPALPSADVIDAKPENE
jgi:hypothetical protein